MPTRIVSPGAKQDLLEISLDLARHTSEATSQAVLTRIRRSFALLGRHPLIGRARDTDLGPGLRTLTSGGYIIVYRTVPDAVFILRVIDGRRDYPALLLP